MEALVFLFVEKTNSIILSSKAGSNVIGIVGARIVDYDSFPLSVILGNQAVQTFWQIFCTVVARNDNAKERIITRHLLFIPSGRGEKGFNS